MNTLTANEAKVHFGDMLLQAQQAPIQINRNGKPVAIVMSVKEYENMEAIKLQMLQLRAAQAQADIASGNLTDTDAFMDELIAGSHD